MVGYGGSFVLNGQSPLIKQYDSVIGQAELKFFLTANPSNPEQPSNVSLTLSSIAIGYNRDFQSSFLGDFYGSDRGYAKIQYMFAGRVLASLEGGLGAIEYPDLFSPDGTVHVNPFTDLRADATFFGEYRFSNTFGLNTTIRYTANFSDTSLPGGLTTGVTGAGTGAAPVLPYDMNWRRFEAYIGARWFL
jgi:hypothetical protein